MKSFLAGSVVAATVAWVIYSMAGPTDCEKVNRGAAPVRAVFDVTRWATQNWFSTQDRLKLLLWSIQADDATKGFIAHQFYGATFSCGGPKK